jgi:hypothetical protein
LPVAGLYYECRDLIQYTDCKQLSDAKTNHKTYSAVFEGERVFLKEYNLTDERSFSASVKSLNVLRESGDVTGVVLPQCVFRDAQSHSHFIVARQRHSQRVALRKLQSTQIGG